MKKISLFAMFAMMVVAFVVLPSCKDDDEKTDGPGNEGGEENIEDADDAQARAYWSVVGQLVDVSTTNDGASVLQPSIGYASSSDASVRYVLTNTIEGAAARFNGLVGSDLVDESTSSKTWTDENVGTLTYTKTNDGKSLATVDVDIKNLNLSRIVYLTPDQTDNNGKFTGTAYYRFGDIVSKTNADGKAEFWICVRPAFGPEGKEKSHWITLSPVPDKFLAKYTSKTNNVDYSYPKQSAGMLKGDNYAISTDHYQNLAEMLYAIANPSGWSDNILYNTKAPIFNDFSRDNLKYHNSGFWKRVQEAWKALGIDTKVFGQSLTSIESSLNNTSEGLHLLYDGSWSWSLSNYLYLYEYVYTNGTGKYVNMHTQTKTKTSKDVIKGGANKSAIKIDFATQYTEATPYIKNADFFGNDAPRYLARYATGEQLASDGKFDVKQPIAGVTEIYRYNDYYHITNLNSDPEVASLSINSIIEGYFAAGDVVKTKDGSRWICVAGSPSHEATNITNHEAYFISFDNVTVGSNPNIIGNQTDAIVTAFKIRDFLNTLQGMQDDKKYESGQSLGTVLTKIKELTGVDMSKMFVERDSIWSFKSNNVVVESESTNYMTSIAYGDNCDLVRYVFDVTRAGTKRAQNPSGIKPDWYHWFYTKYEQYDASKIRALTDTEKDTYLYTKWNLPWTISNTTMNITDVSSDALVMAFAGTDKWATLPLVGTTQRQSYRSSSSNYAAADYVYKEGQDFKTNMYNEPVLVMRLMKVDDNGTATQTAPDGTAIEVLNHITDANYKLVVNVGWVGRYLEFTKKDEESYLNNQGYKLPALPTKQ